MQFDEAANGWFHLSKALEATPRQLDDLLKWEEVILKHRPTRLADVLLMIDCVLSNEDARPDRLDKVALGRIRAYLFDRQYERPVG